ncbi:MAG: type II secretion system protein [Deltaproteobacteria bacterium]|nr:type II secretion system protein [Deltaproteobacteria bacterium]
MKRSGFTLFEIMAVMLIVSLAFGVVTLGVRAIDMSEVDATALRLSGTIRMAFDTAALQSAQVKITLDLDAQTYSLDASLEADLLDPEVVRVRDGETIFDEKKRTEGTGSSALPGGGGGFDPFPGLLDSEKKNVKIPAPTRIHGAWTPAFEGMVKKGVVVLRFFPLGYAERAYIYLSSDDDHIVTLIVHPYLGRVDVEQGLIPVPDEEKRERGAEAQETIP